MASPTHDGDSREDEIWMWREEDWCVITGIETGATTQGATRKETLEIVDDVVAAHTDETGHEPTGKKLHEPRIDPDSNTTGNNEIPELIQQVARRTFSGKKVLKALANVGNFEWSRTTGDHAQLYSQHSTNNGDCQHGTVPLYDELKTGFEAFYKRLDATYNRVKTGYTIALNRTISTMLVEMDCKIQCLPYSGVRKSCQNHPIMGVKHIR